MGPIGPATEKMLLNFTNLSLGHRTAFLLLVNLKSISKLPAL